MMPHTVNKNLSILRVHGRLAGGLDRTELAPFRRAVDDILRDSTDLAIDLSDVGAVDSEGVGELARALGHVSRLGGRLALIGPGPQVRRVLSITRLDTVFRLVPSEAHAIEVLGAGSFEQVQRHDCWTTSSSG